MGHANVAYVLLRSAAGEIWTVRYARDITNGHMHESQINQICAEAVSDESTLQFRGVDCKLISNGGLPTHVRPHPGH